MKKSLFKKSKGFTLIELMVVMAIIAVLAVLVIGAIQIARRTATETANRSNARTIQAGLEAYYAKNKRYPDISGGTTFTTAVSSGQPLNGYVTLGSTVCANGGGTVTSSSNAYTIVIVDYGCTNSLGENITNQ